MLTNVSIITTGAMTKYTDYMMCIKCCLSQTHILPALLESLVQSASNVVALSLINVKLIR